MAKDKTTQELVTKADLKSTEVVTSKAEKALDIKTDDDVENAAYVLIDLKDQFDTLEEKRKSYIQPAQETIDRINTDFKKLTQPRNAYIKTLKDAIVLYVSGRYAESKLKEKELQKEMKTRSLVLDPGLSKIVTAIGEVRFRKTTDIKVTNRNIVPEKYWVLDVKAIEKDLDDGDEIPGIKIKVDPIGVAAIYKDKS